MPVDNQLYNRAGDIWWDENEPLSMLRTMLNPVRFGFFSTVLIDELRIDTHGRTVLDVGCGGGLLAEEFARLGFCVVGIDPSLGSLLTAQKHAAQSGLHIDYVGGVGELIPFANEFCDIVVCCDVLEHVESPSAVIAEISRVLKQDGIFLYDTINRTLRSKIAVIELCQECAWTRCLPPNLHDWNRFIRPRELREIMAQHGLQQRVVAGMKPHANPIALIRQMRKRQRGEISYGELGRRMKMGLSEDLSISYVGWAFKCR